MKSFLVIIILVLSSNLFATAMMNCPAGQFRILSPYGGMTCSSYYPQTTPATNNCVMCQLYQQQQQMSMMPWYTQNNPYPFYNPNPQPWWATQGQLYYPNMMYPGAWQYPGMVSHQYHGSGDVFAAKPNVYVSAVNENIKFDFKFTSENPSFIVTTPHLNEDNSWKGKIVEKDKFSVNDIFYDYLFYDVRLKKEDMQFTAGFCADRESAIVFMLSDLRDLKHSEISLQDFEEHWRVKIPAYPHYCVYPQYNKQLDTAFPVTITPLAEHIRSLYILVPHKDVPRFTKGQFPPLPSEDSNSLRPSVLIQKELEFREWGVAFMAQEAVIP